MAKYKVSYDDENIMDPTTKEIEAAEVILDGKSDEWMSFYDRSGLKWRLPANRVFQVERAEE